jgi:hypothetical protein
MYLSPCSNTVDLLQIPQALPKYRTPCQILPVLSKYRRHYPNTSAIPKYTPLIQIQQAYLNIAGLVKFPQALCHCCRPYQVSPALIQYRRLNPNISGLRQIQPALSKFLRPSPDLTPARDPPELYSPRRVNM